MDEIKPSVAEFGWYLAEYGWELAECAQEYAQLLLLPTLLVRKNLLPRLSEYAEFSPLLRKIYEKSLSHKLNSKTKKSQNWKMIYYHFYVLYVISA